MDKVISLVPQYIFSAFVIALYIVFLVYLFKLEKIGCKCALNWRRNYLIVFMILALSSNFISMFVPAIKFNIFLLSLATILSLMFYVFTFQYVRNLKDDKCACSENLTREIMYYYSLIMLVLFILSLTLVFFMIYRVSSLQSKSQVKTIKKYKK
jgi:hypothetical protein